LQQTFSLEWRPRVQEVLKEYRFPRMGWKCLETEKRSQKGDTKDTEDTVSCTPFDLVFFFSFRVE
jgi:hypothetical protein